MSDGKSLAQITNIGYNYTLLQFPALRPDKTRCDLDLDSQFQDVARQFHELLKKDRYPQATITRVTVFLIGSRIEDEQRLRSYEESFQRAFSMHEVLPTPIFCGVTWLPGHAEMQVVMDACARNPSPISLRME